MKKQLKNETSEFYQENNELETVGTGRRQTKISWLSKAGQFLLSGEKTKIEHREHRTNGNLRTLGIGVIDKVSWGTHLCQFYLTKEDLITILVPYFKAGLENNEFCMWITSEPLTAEKAKKALQKEVKNLNDYIKNGQIQILDYSEWYIKSGKFESIKVLQGWIEKEDQALKKGFDGVRITGNTFWLDQKDWRDFNEYEANIDNVIGEHRMIAICSYSLNKCGASEILDVVGNHQYCLIKQNGKWGLTQSAGRLRAEEEIESLAKFPSEDPNPVFRVAKDGRIIYANDAGLPLLDEWNTRIGELISNEWTTLIFESFDSKRVLEKDLTFRDQTFSFIIAPIINTDYVNIYGRNITERKHAEKNLKHAHSDLNQIFNAAVPLCVIGKDYTMVRVNDTFCSFFDMKKEDVLGKKCNEIWQDPFCNTRKCPMKQILNGMEQSEHEVIDKNLSDGRKVSCIVKAIPYRDINGELFGIVENFIDITGRKQTEEELKKYRSHLEEIAKERTVRLLATNEQLKQEITKRRLTEEILQQKAEIIDQIHDSVVSTDCDGYVTTWNKGAERLFGYLKEEALGKHISFVYPKEEHEFLEHEVIAPLKQNGIYEKEVRMIKKSGEDFYAHLSLSLLRDNEGTITGMIGYSTDITGRKKAEDALRKSEEKYKTLVENSRDFICVVDLKGNFIFTNKAFETILGYTPEDLNQINGFELIHPEDLEIVKKRFNGVIDGKIQNDFDYRYKTKKGSYINILVNAVPLFDPQGNVFAAYGIARDITERKCMEKALRQSEAKYRNLMENASDAIVIADEEGNVLQVNKKAETLLGYTRKELINMNIAQIHPKEDLERTFKAYKEIRRRGEGGLTKGFILRKDGKTVPVDITGNVINYGDKEVMQGIFRDITEQKRIEKEFQKIEKLEAIGVLAGGIAHDFNNLLTSIIGNLSLAELYVKPGDDIFETLQRAKNASKRAGQLTKQLLTFSKGGAPIKQTASISELIEDTAIFALRGSKVRCEYSLPANLWPVEIDKGQISQIINNLIINANHAMPVGGIIRIKAENVTINGNNNLPLKKGKYVKVSVKDQGIGIPKEYLGKIFDPYFTTKENGSGLGLASCYSIAKNHGGYITAESEIGAGAIFYIYLPVSDKEIFEVKEIAEEELYLGKGTILFMDDEKEVINTAQQMVVQLGYEIKIALNGTEAINMYKKAKESGGPFNVVILDLTIPGDMGGKETIKRLLEIDPEVKAIVSSGYSNNPIMADYKIYGFKDVVAKPYEIQQLSEVLYRVINGKDVIVST